MTLRNRGFAYANCIPHSCGSLAGGPDFFDSDFDPHAIHPATGKPFTKIDWAENIVLSNANIEEFLTVALSSAPK